LLDIRAVQRHGRRVVGELEEVWGHHVLVGRVLQVGAKVVHDQKEHVALRRVGRSRYGW
jgi:hypothetical protein